jgi:hypothetical protein
MSHDAGQLLFWRPTTQPLANPAALVAALDAGHAPTELHDLDIPAILAALKKTYPSFNPDDPFIDVPPQQTAITFKWSPKHVAAFFEGDPFRQMDKLSLLMSSLGLACYDAFTSQAFTADAPPRFVADPLTEAYDRILSRIQVDFSNNFLASRGYPVDKKLGFSPALRRIARVNSLKSMELTSQMQDAWKAYRNSFEYAEELHKRWTSYKARHAKKAARASQTPLPAPDPAPLPSTPAPS